MLPHSSRHGETPAFDLDVLVDTATRRIAPTWPLDRFIAVNPLWGFVEQPLPEVAGRLEALVGSRMLMPRAWYRRAWTMGRLRPTHLRAAIERSGSERTVARLETLLEHDAHTPRRRPLMTDVMDATRDLTKSLAWADVVPGAISRVCASHFTAGGGTGLWEAWRRQAPEDQSAELLVGGTSLRPHAASLPTSRDGLLRLAVAELDVEPRRLEDYLTALLLDVNGWASMCAYERFQAELEGESDDLIVDLLAIRLAWELLLFRAGGPRLASRWQLAMAGWPTFDDAAEERRDDWLLQTAMEVAYQSEIAEGLTRGVAAPRADAPRAQAAFCIDVRSEVFRRALEATSGDVDTLGFAGFFGLPAAYQPIGTNASRPQLPGLLAPAVRVTDEAPAGTDARRAARLDRGAVATAFQKSAIGGFPFVEALGLGFGAKLLANAFGLARPVRHPETAGLRHAEHHARRPRLTAKADGSPLATEERVDLAEGILRAMSLTRGFARIVALVGHGSQTANNPHAAGYDCGACCGQAGAVNARATADLLDDPEVRAGLRARGIDIPESTRFLGGLHDTTTDEVTLFDTERLGAEHAGDLAALRGWLATAGETTRRERAGSLGYGSTRDDRALLQELRRRARDWSEVRPEWGLAGNAAFVVAPREKVKHLDLGGRAFLHDYRAEEDGAGWPILTQIMTAPMVVTHWINFQYYASTVDNRRFGSGNKVLHDVVGGHLGVFEGNGGDLRIGLPMQSLHDGQKWVHEPLRLSVFIAAPREAIDGVIAAHGLVAQLVDNGWLHLLQIDQEDAAVHVRLPGGGWEQGVLPYDA